MFNTLSKVSRLTLSSSTLHNFAKFSTKQSFPSNLAKLTIRVSPYGQERFPLSSLGQLEPVKNGGWQIIPFDKSISKSLRRSLVPEASALGFRVFFDTKRETLVVKPKKDKTLKKIKSAEFVAPLYDNEGFVVEDIDYESLYDRRKRRQSKVFTSVDQTHARKRKNKTVSSNYREKQAHEVAEELGLNFMLTERVGRIASKNKKAMRQMLKRVSQSFTFEEKKPSFE
jgi:hypothetical protein